MANPVIHIKDAYFFEVPKVLWPCDFNSRAEFPDVWIKLDADFQQWEADRLHDRLVAFVSGQDTGEAGQGAVRVPVKAELIERYHHWMHHDHANVGKPLDVYLDEQAAKAQEGLNAWKEKHPQLVDFSARAYLNEHAAAEDWFFLLSRQPGFQGQWDAMKTEAGDLALYKTDAGVREWSSEKIEAYNENLSGKVLIPQPFGELRNLHQPEPGWNNFCISKFMVIEVAVAILIFAIFRWLAGKMSQGDRPKGMVWNLLESLVVFVREQIARPAIGAHDADRFVPLLWTIFTFILGCNLFGMVPGIGSPTGAWGVTMSLALVTFGTVIVSGMRQFGFLGFFKNQVPHMELPLVLAIVIKPFILAIELLGLVIKHAVLSIRLLANMVAGHLVILAIMGMAFGFSASVDFQGLPDWQWWLTAVIAVVGSALFNVLELLVAFLQAYIFTFLSALFIGASIHHH